MPLGRPQNVSEGRPQEVGRTPPLEVNIRRYENVLKISTGHVFKTSVGASHCVTYRAVWGCLQEVTLGRPQGVIFQRLNDVSRGRSLALRREPFGDVHRTSFRDVLRTSSGCNSTKWDIFRKQGKNLSLI